ncbi:MAG: hypothetical protein U1F33_04485 [Alphaproteobacteria bacterium]
MTRRLPPIPIHDLDAASPVALVEVERERAAALLAIGRKTYGPAMVAIADRLSRRWLVRTANPYRHEIDLIAAMLRKPGTHLLNLSFEWGCTTAIAPDPKGAGLRLLRTLDWPLDGIGRHLVVARHKTPHGLYHNLTWPGFAGIVTASAPGRFAAALNQPPMRRRGLPFLGDWLLNRAGQWRQGGLPPTHLLRAVFEECRSYVEARERLASTPLCIPAIFSLCGLEEGCIIERTEQDAVIHRAPACATNHWQSPIARGQGRTADSEERLREMRAWLSRGAQGFDWLTPPILNRTTRLALIANPRRESLLVQGFEAEGPATQVLEIEPNSRPHLQESLTDGHLAV